MHRNDYDSPWNVKVDKEESRSMSDWQPKNSLKKKINGLEAPQSLNNFWRGNSKRSGGVGKIEDDVKECGKLKTKILEEEQLLVKMKYT